LGFPSQYHSTHAPYYNFIKKPLLPEGRKEEVTENKKKNVFTEMGEHVIEKDL